MSVPNGFHNRNPENIDQLVRGLRALDDSRTSKAILIRDTSLRLLLIAYIIDFVFSFGLVTTAAVIGFGAIFVATQAYITIKFQREANYSLKEWVFLYKNRSRLSKGFILLGFVLILFLAIQLVVLVTIEIPQIESVQNNIIHTVLIMFFMATFIITTLLEELSSTIVQYRIQKYSFAGSREPLIEQEMEDDEAQDGTYRKLALNILMDSRLLTPQSRAEKTQSEKHKNFTVNLSDSDESTDVVPQSPQEQRHKEALRESATKKLESIGADTDSIALGPEELDVLTEEEIDALLPGSFKSQDDDHQYNWER